MYKISNSSHVATAMGAVSRLKEHPCMMLKENVHEHVEGMFFLLPVPFWNYNQWVPLFPWRTS